jgi:hypothetical protein
LIQKKPVKSIFYVHLPRPKIEPIAQVKYLFLACFMKKCPDESVAIGSQCRLPNLKLPRSPLLQAMTAAGPNPSRAAQDTNS